MKNSRELNLRADFWERLRLYFDGSLSDSPKRIKEFLNMLNNESDEGLAALKWLHSELQRKGIDRTLKDLNQYLFSSERNPALLDLCNPNGEASNPRSSCTLKVKVYMGEGWKSDFKYLDLFSPPDLYVEVGIANGDEQMNRTEFKKNSWKPTWGEEFSFNLADPEAALLSIKVYDHDSGTTHDFAGETTLQVSLLSPGIRFVPLLFKDGKKCSATGLLMRFEFV